MYLKIISQVIIIILIGAMQIGFLSGLPLPFSLINLVAVSLIFVLYYTNVRIGLGWALGLGIIFDIYSFHFFGLHIVSLVLAVWVAHLLLDNFFTNRSLLAPVVLCLCVTAIHQAVSHFLLAFLFFIKQEPYLSDFGSDFWIGQVNMLLVNLIFSLVVFFIVGLAITRLRPTLMIKLQK